MNYRELEQEVHRTCTNCAGSVNIVEGQIACALPKPFPCVLLDVLAEARKNPQTALEYDSEWVGTHAKTKAKQEA